MYIDIKAVALRTVPHNDRTSILTAWSPGLGKISLAMPAGKGKASALRRALTMPLSLFEGVVDRRAGSDIMQVRDIRSYRPDGRQLDVSSHPVRASVAMFVAEVLGVVTREGDSDPVLWNLAVETAVLTDSGNAPALAMLPLMFLLRLARVLGIEPDWAEWREGGYFDMREGVFRSSRPLHDYNVKADEMLVLGRLARLAPGYRHIGMMRLGRDVRLRLLGGLTDYFAMHHYPLDRLRSLDILHAVFN